MREFHNTMFAFNLELLREIQEDFNLPTMQSVSYFIGLPNPYWLLISRGYYPGKKIRKRICEALLVDEDDLWVPLTRGQLAKVKHFV